jgi:enoyl-CoA hydratase
MSVRIDKSGPVWTVVLSRPERRNAVDGPTAAALADAFRAFDGDAEARVAVLFGEGGTFCAGADLKAISEGRGNQVRPPQPAPGAARSEAQPSEGTVQPAPGAARSEAEPSEVTVQAAPGAARSEATRGFASGEPSAVTGDGPMGPSRMQLGKPVIAAVAGHAVAGGLELALWCDLRVAEQSAVFGVFCRRWGVPLIDGGTVRLPRIVGQGRALDMILTGRPVGAEEALRMGLADRVVPDGQGRIAAEALAADIARFPQRCMRADRRSAFEAWSLDESAAIANELRHGLEVIRSGETLEGAARFAAGAGRHGSFTETP